MAIEQQEAPGIGGQRQQADDADGFAVGQDGMERFVNRLRRHAQAEGEHDQAFQQRRPRLPHLVAGQNIQAEAIHQRIAQHVRGIRQQGGGMRSHAGDGFHREHDGVDGQHDLEHAAMLGAHGIQGARLVFAATGHE